MNIGATYTATHDQATLLDNVLGAEEDGTTSTSNTPIKKSALQRAKSAIVNNPKKAAFGVFLVMCSIGGAIAGGLTAKSNSSATNNNTANTTLGNRTIALASTVPTLQPSSTKALTTSPTVETQITTNFEKTLSTLEKNNIKTTAEWIKSVSTQPAEETNTTSTTPPTKAPIKNISTAHCDGNFWTNNWSAHDCCIDPQDKSGNGTKTAFVHAEKNLLGFGGKDCPTGEAQHTCTDSDPVYEMKNSTDVKTTYNSMSSYCNAEYETTPLFFDKEDKQLNR